MDLKVSISGDDSSIASRMRKHLDACGMSMSDTKALDDSRAFAIWCGKTPPPDGYQVWCCNTKSSFTSEDVSRLGLQFIISLNAGAIAGSIYWCSMTSRDGLVRYFQNERDLSQFLVAEAGKFEV